ncbi:MAG: hypothetical protein II095_02455 [Bacteroidales bacterium]|nr:hypothetical protein [Bacteroidales bacterium]
MNFRTGYLAVPALALLVLLASGCRQKGKPAEGKAAAQVEAPVKKTHGRQQKERTADVDTARYNALCDSLAAGDTTGRWPVRTAPYPNKGALLPYHRIVAYYGNMYSKRMGVLGEYPPDTLWQKLNAEIRKWEAADPSTPVIPAIHYIAASAQGSPGRDKMYRMRMPAKQIDSALAIAAMGDAIVFLDIQVGHSTVQKEVPVLEEYLKLPNVHLALDPEFAMHGGVLPGKKIGTMDAKEINWCAEYLQNLVKENGLPPKVLIVHRFTEGMVTGASKIRPLPEVQIVMDMDGWGGPALKKNTYRQCIFKAPVQFAGFKLFYKNDLREKPYRMLTPEEVLGLCPKPIYIQYQ